MRVNDDYTYVNAKSQVNDPCSVYNYWRRLLGIRKSDSWADVLVHGEFRMLALTNEKVMVFERTGEKSGKKILAVMNFKEEAVTFDLRAEEVPIAGLDKEEVNVDVLISNYDLVDGGRLTIRGGTMELRVFEAMIIVV